MILPHVNERKIYKYNEDEVIVWQQDLFIRVYIRTIPKNGGSVYYTENWWKFMRKAKLLKVLHENNAY